MITFQATAYKILMVAFWMAIHISVCWGKGPCDWLLLVCKRTQDHILVESLCFTDQNKMSWGNSLVEHVTCSNYSTSTIKEGGSWSCLVTKSTRPLVATNTKKKLARQIHPYRKVGRYRRSRPLITRNEEPTRGDRRRWSYSVKNITLQSQEYQISNFYQSCPLMSL